jgi:hypothetical protein
LGAGFADEEAGSWQQAGNALKAQSKISPQTNRGDKKLGSRLTVPRWECRSRRKSGKATFHAPVSGKKHWREGAKDNAPIEDQGKETQRALRFAEKAEESTVCITA